MLRTLRSWLARPMPRLRARMEFTIESKGGIDTESRRRYYIGFGDVLHWRVRVPRWFYEWMTDAEEA